MRLYIVFIILLSTISFSSFAQQDSLNYAEPDTVVRHQPAPMTLLDSVAAASAARQQFLSDSLAMVFIKLPDPDRANQFVAQMLKEEMYTGHGFLDVTAKIKKNQGMGIARRTRDNWVIGVVIFILLYAGFLRLTITKDISNILESIYSKQLFSRAEDDTTLLSSWAFLGLLVLMGLTFGLFLYQVSGYYQVYYPVGGSALFVSLSVVVILSFSLKLLILKFLGFVFQLSSVVDRYIAVLCFTYFAITFILLPVIACFSLITAQLIPGILLIALFLSGAILVWLYLRNSVIIISNFRFSKFYLIVYLCALEICPVLILIKALNI